MKELSTPTGLPLRRKLSHSQELLHPTADIARPIPIVLADDHPLFREGLMRLLAPSAEFSVAGQTGTCAETRTLIERLRPDVLVLDLFMNGGGGVGFVEDLSRQFPDVKLLILADQEEALYGPASVRAGASGYVMKNRPATEVLAALRCVAVGCIYTSPELRLIQFATCGVQGSHTGGGLTGVMSSRELDVFHLLGRRLTTAEVAAKLMLSSKTIESYYERLKQKLSCPSMRELHQLAQEFAHVLPS